MPLHPTTRRPALTALALAVAVTLPGSAGAQDGSISDIRRDREAARDATAEAIAELEYLELEDARVAEITAEIQLSVDAQAAKVESARQQLVAAEAEVIRREDLATAAEAEIDRTEAAVTTRAIDAFVGTDPGDTEWLVSADVNRSAVRLAYLDFAAGNDRDAIDRLRDLHATREEHVRAGVEARKEADELRATLETELVELESRRQVQVEVQGELQTRIAEWQAEADRRAREAEELTDLIKTRQAEELGFPPGDPGASSVQGFVMPSGGTPGSPFGPRVHPIFGRTRMHTGVDIGGSTGDPIWASKAGRVIFAGAKGGYGNTVIIQHEGLVATLYAHMSALEAADGDWVEQGEVVGLVGSTGWSTGPHLHFETRVDGVPKDPLLFLPA